MRNYNAEKTAGKGNLALRVVGVKEARLEASTMELMLIAQITDFCGLPTVAVLRDASSGRQEPGREAPSQ